MCECEFILLMKAELIQYEDSSLNGKSFMTNESVETAKTSIKIGQLIIKLKNCLRNISLGQYPTKFYHTGMYDNYSSICGGIVTLLCLIMVLVYLIILLNDVFSRNQYNLDRYIREL